MSDFKSTLTDSHILKHTVRSEADDKGRVKLQYRFGDDHVLTSEQIAADSIKGSVLISWCNAVRSTEEQRMNDKEEEGKRPEYTPEAVERKTRPSAEVSPEEMIFQKYEELSKRVPKLREELAQAEKDLKKWEKVSEALGNSAGVDYTNIPVG